MLSTLLAPSAHAGHWQFSAAGSTVSSVTHAKASPQTPPAAWTPPAPADNSLNLNLPNIGVRDMSGSVTPSCDFTLKASVHILATWVTDTTSDNTIPPTVWLTETAAASWKSPGNPYTTCSGSADNGLSDAYVSPGPPTFSGSSMNATGAVPPDGWHSYTVTVTNGTGTVTLPVRSLSVTALGTGQPYGLSGAVSLTGSLSYSIAVHAQPYNFHLTVWQDGSGITEPGIVIDNTAGKLYFHYNFSSTDGVIANAVNNTTMYEYVDYSGNTSGSYIVQNGITSYIPPSPPFNNINPQTGATAVYQTPQKNLFNASNLQSGTVLDVLSPPPYGFTPAPYVGASWHGVQNMYFDDVQTGETKVVIPGPGNHSPYTITRAVTPGVPSNTAVYSVTKDGSTATKSLP